MNGVEGSRSRAVEQGGIRYLVLGAASPAQHKQLGLRGCQEQEPALAPQARPEEATELLQGLGPSAHSRGGMG